MVYSKFPGLDASDINAVIKDEAAKLYAADDHKMSLDRCCEYLNSQELKGVLSSIKDNFKKSYYLRVVKEFSKAIDNKIIIRHMFIVI